MEETLNEELSYNDVVNSLRGRNVEIPQENIAPNLQIIPSHQRKIEKIQHNR